MGLRKICKTCALKDICKIVDVIGEEGTCQQHTRTSPPLCVICDNPALTPTWTGTKAICNKCLDALGTCYTCELANECKFQTDPNQIEKYLVKVVQNRQVRVKNPTRIEMFCKSCNCYNTELNGCNKQDFQNSSYPTCCNYKELSF
jgi:hypothetical protein